MLYRIQYALFLYFFKDLVRYAVIQMWNKCQIEKMSYLHHLGYLMQSSIDELILVEEKQIQVSFG